MKILKGALKGLGVLFGFFVLLVIFLGDPESDNVGQVEVAEAVQEKNSQLSKKAINDAEDNHPHQDLIDKAWKKYSDGKEVVSNADVVILPYVKSFQPLDVSIKNDKLLITLPQTSITDDMYAAVLRAVCSSIYLDDRVWKGVAEIQVLNQHSHQGYVFEGGERQCAYMGGLIETDIYVLGKTHLF